MLDYDSETRIKPLEAIHHSFFRKEGSFLPPSLPIDLTHGATGSGTGSQPFATGSGGSQPFYPPVVQTHGTVTSQEPMIISQEIVSLDANHSYHTRQSSELISGRHIQMRYSPPPPTVFLPHTNNNNNEHTATSSLPPSTRTNPYPIPMNIGHPIPLPTHHVSSHHPVVTSGQHHVVTSGQHPVVTSSQHAVITSSYSPNVGTRYDNTSYQTESSPSAKLYPIQQNGSTIPPTFYGTNALFNDPNNNQFSFSFSPSQQQQQQQPHPPSIQPHPSHHAPYSTVHRTDQQHGGAYNHSIGKSRRTKSQTNHVEAGDSPMMGVVLHR